MLSYVGKPLQMSNDKHMELRNEEALNLSVSILGNTDRRVFDIDNIGN